MLLGICEEMTQYGNMMSSFLPFLTKSLFQCSIDVVFYFYCWPRKCPQPLLNTQIQSYLYASQGCVMKTKQQTYNVSTVCMISSEQYSCDLRGVTDLNIWYEYTICLSKNESYLETERPCFTWQKYILSGPSFMY